MPTILLKLATWCITLWFIIISFSVGWNISLFTVCLFLNHSNTAATYTPTSGKLYLFMSWKPKWRSEVGTAKRVSFFSLSPLLKLWLLKERKLQKALINGSRDAPALSHSVPHNRQTYEAEPGMEYWRNEWKHTQIRDPTSPRPLLVSALYCVSLLKRVCHRSPILYQLLKIKEAQRRGMLM